MPVLKLAFVLVLALAACRGTATAGAQQQAVPPMRADADPAFEVAAITLSDPNNGSSGFQVDGRHVTILNQTVQSMLVFAYGLQKSQLVNAPAWFGTDHYDVRGVPDVPGEPNFEQIKSMVRKLLADRYALHTHDDHRDLLCYALHVAKDGPRLKKTASAPSANGDQTGNNGRVNEWRFTNESMPDCAQFLQFIMDRPVVDQTGLPGKFDFFLKWASDNVLEHDPEAGPSLFTAMPEQIGIKLETTHANARVLVIDHLDRPSAN